MKTIAIGMSAITLVAISEFVQVPAIDSYMRKPSEIGDVSRSDK